MSYIRTKNKVYCLDDLDICKDLQGKPYVTKTGWLIYKEQILKQAEDVEELFDEYIVVEEGHQAYTEGNFWDIPIDSKIYGAIWSVNNGEAPRLITVAVFDNHKEEWLLIHEQVY